MSKIYERIYALILINLKFFSKNLKTNNLIDEKTILKIKNSTINLKDTILYNYLKNTKIENYHDFILNSKKLSTVYRNVKSLNGFDFDILKSALQKYIRRGDYIRGVNIACEIDMFRFFPGGKGEITNFYNRLRVITLEDIGLGCPEVLFLVDTYLINYLVCEKDELSIDLINCIKQLCLVPHSRFYSHVKCYYLNNKKECGIPNIKINLGKNENLRQHVDNMVWCLENRDDFIVYPILKILEVEKLNEKINKNTRPGFLIFDIFRKIVKMSNKVEKTLEICERWYKTLKVQENFLCCIHPIYFYFYEKETDFIFSESEKYLFHYNSILLQKKYEISDYCYDKHTKVGRRLNRDDIEFAIEGSLVSYEKMVRTTSVFQTYSSFYRNSKINLEKLSTETSEFKFKIRAQLVCSACRQDTYFAEDKMGRNVVVKGPYLTYESAIKCFNIVSILRLFKGINTCDVNIKYLIPDLFESTPLGCRNKILKNTPYYFIVMKDLMDIDNYPEKIRESKVWPETKVVDFEKLFSENKNLGFGVSTEMSDKACFSFALQLCIRNIFKLGDFANRNFLRVGDKLYNLDVENYNVNDKIRFAKDQKIKLSKIVSENYEKFRNVLESWKNNKNIEKLIEITFGEKICISEKVDKILSDFDSIF